MPASARLKPQPTRSRGRPKLEDVAAIESSLLDIALKEFIQHGYGGTSMRRIVIAAKISNTTLYSRFPSKEDLFRALILEQSARLSAPNVLRTATGLADLEQGLKTYANLTIETSLKGDLLHVNRLIATESHRFPELGAAAAERMQMGIRQIADFIKVRAKEDKIPCRDPEGVAEVFITMLRGWYLNMMLTNRKVSVALREQWVERAVHTLLKGRKDW